MAIEDETMAPKLVAVMWTMSVVSVLFVILRFFFKHQSGKKFYVDDWFLVVSWLCLALYAAFITTATRYGLGRHLSTLSHYGIVESHRFLATSYFFGTISLPLSKTSFAMTLLRLTQARWRRLFIFAIILTTNVFLWISAIFLFTSCSPVERIFDPTLPGTCLNGKALLYYNQFSASWSAAMDIVLVLYTWSLLWGLNMRLVEKIGVCIAMSFGMLSGIVGAIRVTYMGDGSKWSDWTYNVDTIVWSGAETALVIIAACIPFLRTTYYVTKVAKGSSDKESRGWSIGFPSSGSSTRGLTNHSRNDNRSMRTHPAEAMLSGAVGASVVNNVHTEQPAAATGDAEKGRPARLQ